MYALRPYVNVCVYVGGPTSNTEPFWEKGMAAYKKIYSENGGKDHDLSALGERENPDARFGASVTQNGGD